MHVTASVAVSLDGRIDDHRPERLLLSSPEDLDRVDEVRAGVDAILVGAGTVLADDPRLQVRSAERRAARVARGEPETPLRVVLAGRRPLDPAARVFDGGGAVVLQRADVAGVLDDLAARGVRRLLVEGGTGVHTAFLAAGAVDELHLAVAPLLVGDGPRFVHPAAFPPGQRWRLVDARAHGDTVVCRYRR